MAKKNLKKLETSEAKAVDMSKIKKVEKKQQETEIKPWHFPKQGKVIHAASYEEALKKLNI